jgi:serine/threonine-protein kinase
MAAPDATGAPGAYFIVMEFVDGLHLKGVLESLRRQGRRLTVAEVLYLVMEVCKGLSYAHEIHDPETGRPLGIVHRDISPPNILLSKNGEVKLVDFGLAKATSQIESTDPGVVKGKFSYLSPEAANGREVDKRADIFAVGILLYELLTGKRLFYGENDFQTVELVRQARVPSLSQQNQDVEAELDLIVRKALSRDLEQRYQTAGELLDALAQYLFSRGLKVTSRDIAQLVRTCLAERHKTLPPVVAQKKSLIDTLIQEELVKFTSLDAVTDAATGPAGAVPLSPEELSGPSGAGGNTNPGIALPGLMVNTANWAEELVEATPTIGRPNIRDLPAVPTRNGVAPIPRASERPARAAAAAAPAEVESLEKMLEPEPSAVRSAAALKAKAAAARPGGAPMKSWVPAMLVALLVLILASGGVVLYLVRTGH